MSDEKPRKQIKKQKWEWRMLVDAYILAREGHTNADIARILGLAVQWMKEKTNRKERYNVPELIYALDKARSQPKESLGKQFKEYVAGQLDPELKELWDKIEYWSDADGGYDKIQQLLHGQRDAVLQNLFVHAMIHTNFNINEACRMASVTKRRIDVWSQEDPTFVELLNTLEWHKKNFFESALSDLAAARVPSAVIFANRTLNKDRGYSEKVTVEHTGQVNHVHAVISVDKLDLPLDVRRQVLDAIRACNAKETGAVNALEFTQQDKDEAEENAQDEEDAANDDSE